MPAGVTEATYWVTSPTETIAAVRRSLGAEASADCAESVATASIRPRSGARARAADTRSATRYRTEPPRSAASRPSSSK